MTQGTRRWPLALPALYVAVVAFRAAETAAFGWALLGVAIIAPVILGRSRDDAAPGTKRPRVASALFLSIALATSALAERLAWAAFVREIAAALATFLAVRALARIEGDGGLAHQATIAADTRRRGPSLLATAGALLGGAAWAVAAAFDAVGLARSPLADAPAVAAGMGAFAVFVLGASAFAVAGARRLELTAPPRALAAAASAGLGLVLALALAIFASVRADAAAAIGCAAACCAIVAFSSAKDALAVATRGRRALTLLLFGGPVVTLGALMVSGNIHGAPVVMVVIATVTMIVGALASRLEEPLLPAGGVLLEALRDARAAVRDREPRAAIAHALVRIREAVSRGMGSSPVPSPELWMLHPPRVVTVDAAGYLREKPGSLPTEMLDLARAEPHATLRTDVLGALEVRRADVRPSLKWLENRGAFFATVIVDGDDPDGVLVVPVAAREDTLTLEEARAAKLLADAFVSICQTASSRERHLARERDLEKRIDDLEDQLSRVRHASSLDAARNELAASRLARPATVGLYSAAARLAFEAIERRVAASAPIVLVARSGVDPVPYIARAHLGGPRRGGPLVVVDGTSSREHELERWKDALTSPLALADRGVLVLLDGAALPREIQMLVARSSAERRAPWERPDPLDVVLALTGIATPDALVDEGRLSPELMARFEDAAPIVLPGLRERPEDLRAIVTDRLAREGLRVHGRPIGIDSAAFSRLVDHGWDGEEAELASIVTRLVMRVQGDVVRAADVDALSLPPDKDGYGAQEPVLQ